MKRTGISIVIILIILAAFVIIKQLAVSPETDQVGPIKLGAIFSLTDFGAHWGQSERNAAVMAVEEINQTGGIKGRPLELVIEDNESDLKKTVTAAQKLINVDKVPAVTGPQWQEFAIVAAPVFQTSKAVMLTPSGSSPDLSKAGDYVFSTWPLPVNMVRSLVNHLVKDNPEPEFAIIQVENAFFEMFAQAFKAEITAAGGKVSSYYRVIPDDKDFRTILTKLKAAGVKNVFASLLEGTQVPFYRQATELGLNANFYAPYTIESDEDLMKNPRTAEGVVYPQIASKGNEEFLTKYKARFTDDPSESAAMSYDNVFILAKAIEKVGYSGPAIKNYLESMTNYQGASGNISFDQNGDLASPGEYVIRTIKNGKISDITE